MKTSRYFAAIIILALCALCFTLTACNTTAGGLSYNPQTGAIGVQFSVQGDGKTIVRATPVVVPAPAAQP